MKIWVDFLLFGISCTIFWSLFFRGFEIVLSLSSLVAVGPWGFFVLKAEVRRSIRLVALVVVRVKCALLLVYKTSAS